MPNQVGLARSLSKKAFAQSLRFERQRMYDLEKMAFDAGLPSIIIFEGWDAAGKGGAIKRLTERLDPRGYMVLPIAAPSGDDADKHHLFRFWRRLPVKGQIVIFDRSWYGRVMVERIEGFCTTEEWQRAYREIRDFERQLAGFGTIMFKFWMHLSKQ